MNESTNGMTYEFHISIRSFITSIGPFHLVSTGTNENICIRVELSWAINMAVKCIRSIIINV